MKQVFTTLLALASFTLPAQTLISNTNVVDVRQGKIIANASVLIVDGAIQDVFTTKKYKLPPSTQVIDGSGKYLTPGLADAHIHFSQSGGLYTRPDAFNFTRMVPYEKERADLYKSAEDILRRYLRLGITTVADVGGPLSNFAIRDTLSVAVPSPTVLVTGPLFSMVENKALDNGDPLIVKTTTIAQADSLLNIVLPLKPNYIKIWYIVTEELPAEKTFPVVQHIAKRTHDAKLKLAVHATEFKTADLAVDAGADILVHSVDDQVVTDAFVKKLLARKVSYIPTLTVMDGYITAMNGRLKHRDNDLQYANPFFYSSLSDPEHFSDDELPASFKRMRAMEKPYTNKSFDSVMALNLKLLWAAGVNVVAGTDAGNVGTMHASSMLAELEAMKLAGLSTANVLKSATINSATCFGTNAGTIEKGKVAELVLVEKNPLDDLRNLTTVTHVMKSGKLMKADTLIRETPEMLVQRQVNAYNARNLEAFLDTYSDDIEIYDFPATLISKGKEAMTKSYGPMFEKVKNLHCQIVNRINSGNTIVDHERVRFGDQYLEAVAIYDIVDGKISKVTFK
jgi:imidazolonepropionase-like amidohydrolase